MLKYVTIMTLVFCFLSALISVVFALDNSYRSLLPPIVESSARGEKITRLIPKVSISPNVKLSWGNYNNRRNDKLKKVVETVLLDSEFIQKTILNLGFQTNLKIIRIDLNQLKSNRKNLVIHVNLYTTTLQKYQFALYVINRTDFFYGYIEGDRFYTEHNSLFLKTGAEICRGEYRLLSVEFISDFNFDLTIALETFFIAASQGFFIEDFRPDQVVVSNRRGFLEGVLVDLDYLAKTEPSKAMFILLKQIIRRINNLSEAIRLDEKYYQIHSSERDVQNLYRTFVSLVKKYVNRDLVVQAIRDESKSSFFPDLGKVITESNLGEYWVLNQREYILYSSA